MIYTVPEKHFCGDEEPYKTEEDKCQGRSQGTLRGAAFPICGVHLHWLAGMCPPACGEEADNACDRGQGRDVGKMVGDAPVSPQPQKDYFIISSTIFWRLLSSSYSSWCMLLSLLCLLAVSFLKIVFIAIWDVSCIESTMSGDSIHTAYTFYTCEFNPALST